MRKLIAGIILGTALLCGTKAHAQYNREYFFWVGRSCMMNNDYQEAIRTLNTLLRFDEDAFEGYFLRGIAKYNLDDLLGAEDDFSTAIRLNPVYTQAYTYRAITRSRLGNYDDALQDFREIAVVLLVAFRRTDMGGALGDVDDDIPVAARRLGGGGQQQRLFHAAQLLDGSHAVMHQHNRRGVRQDRGQVLHRV